jgi:hypothetical protein
MNGHKEPECLLGAYPRVEHLKGASFSYSYIKTLNWKIGVVFTKFYFICNFKIPAPGELFLPSLMFESKLLSLP